MSWGAILTIFTLVCVPMNLARAFGTYRDWSDRLFKAQAPTVRHILTLAITAVFVLDAWYIANSEGYFNKLSKPELVSGRQFFNVEVPLDGKDYENCTFNNVTFIYNGGNFVFRFNKVGNFTVSSKSIRVQHTIIMLRAFGLSPSHPVFIEKEGAGPFRYSAPAPGNDSGPLPNTPPS